ncbi:hypothetical protein T265_02261 [Opisthorchis viverrini]|uniref:Uncharacterized protein n=1 Tax=Opisthorchis viverrini TaxID=6198 RepID=A0A074ZVI7_OPIVI|nr:hypothetical protein T265_02261 [Opisthorchis viverrini]KER31488.1 hypothetical protein T265_02261 [Opisthorchis viverrini]
MHAFEHKLLGRVSLIGFANYSLPFWCFCKPSDLESQETTAQLELWSNTSKISSRNFNLISIVVMTAEAPLCCAMVPQLNRVSVLGEKLSSLQRLIFYAIATILPISLCFGISTIFTTLVLGGSCAFYVWRFILERRARRAGDPSGIVIGSGPPPPMTSEGAHIQQASHGTSGGAFGDQLMQNAATGAFKGAIGTAPYPTGNYPGF